MRIRLVLPLLLVLPAFSAAHAEDFEIKDRDVAALVTALQKSNETPGPHRIRLAAGGIYTLQSTVSAGLGLPALRGEIEIDGETHAVQGGAWYDHEWTSSLLGDDQVGWDWFSLRFDSVEALMLFHIRDRSGEVVSSRGSFIHADGRVEPFADGMVEAKAQRQWLSPKTGVRYPLGWRLRSTRFDFDLQVDSVQDAQELDTTVRYWEGAIDARGTLGGREAQAEGYLELTGYGE